MNLTPVKSSNVEAIGYEGSTLTVRFKGGSTYDYYGVLPHVWDELRKAPSVGGFISSRIVKNHKFRKHEEPKHGQ